MYVPEYSDAQLIHGLRGSIIPVTNPQNVNHPTIAKKSGLNVEFPEMDDCIFHIMDPRVTANTEVAKQRISRKRRSFERAASSLVARDSMLDGWYGFSVLIAWLRHH
jgi:hypothetical protein